MATWNNLTKRLKRLPKRLRRSWASRLMSRSFDPVFYYKMYPDLQHLSTSYQLLDHYLNHGKAEGRFGDEASYFLHERKKVRSSQDEKFDLVAYKYFNKDLRSALSSDSDFIGHYIRHGRKEGRRSQFPLNASGCGGQPSAREYWKQIFAPSHVAAWAGEVMEDRLSSKDDFIDIFLDRGLEALWPVRMEYRFDAEFYRSINSDRQIVGLSAHELYRHWLEVGFPAGKLPNESLYLEKYFGDYSYPLEFDWAAYSRDVKLGQKANKWSAIVHLFDHGSASVRRYIKYMGSDAPRILGCVGRYLILRGKPKLAVEATQAALELEISPDLFSLLGDAFRHLNRADEAIEAYRASIDGGTAEISPFLHAIDLCSARKDFDSAFALLTQMMGQWGHRAESEKALHNCVDLYFQHQSARAHAGFRELNSVAGNLTTGQHPADLLLETLDRIHAIYLELDLPPARTGGAADGYIVMLANDDLPQCNHYRIEQKVRQFEVAGISLKVFSHRDVEGFSDSLVGARAAIFYRVAATPPIMRAILQADRMGLPTYYEIDDLIFEPAHYPDSYASYEGQITRQEYAGLQFGVPLFRYAMSLCQNSIASTSELSGYMRKVTKTDNAIVVRNALDDRNEVAVRLGANSETRVAPNKVRIFYGSGTKAHNADFNDIVAPVLIDIMRKYSEVELVLVGYLKISKNLEYFRDRIRVYPFISDVSSYWSLLATCDINIAVLRGGPMTDCKSEIKWLEAAVLQVPSVVSDTAAYREVIRSGEEGYLAANAAEWMTSLTRLIEDPALRQRMGEKARSKALKDYSLASAAELWASELGSAKQSKLAGKKKKRVLICNVFFHPQSIGGATRVVEDNVAYFARNCDDLEIAVFCSDEGATAGRLRVSNFLDVPVYRMSTPSREDADWRPFDPEHAAAFERVLDEFKPDVIHFHCIQRLTATIVEVALKRQIPYVVTLHDAWWISDYQFLVDDDGILRMPTTDVLSDVEHREAQVQSIERRQRLTALLQAASARLSVSVPFAHIHERAGVANVDVIENGVSPLPVLPKVTRADGRLALAHIGGRASHKGAYLVEAALRQEEFNNLHLTMVDGTLVTGQQVETMWGTTPVTLIGPARQSEMSTLYAGVNVLLAPSTWPESFGLVTREALAQGCWVVASSLGAIGQGVHDDENGFVIDTTSSRDLKRVLHRMDQNVEKYRQSPASGGRPLRSTDEQAREFHALYTALA